MDQQCPFTGNLCSACIEGACQYRDLNRQLKLKHPPVPPLRRRRSDWVMVDTVADEVAQRKHSIKEDFRLQIEAAQRSFRLGYYACAKAELHAAIVILDQIEEAAAYRARFGVRN